MLEFNTEVVLEVGFCLLKPRKQLWVQVQQLQWASSSQVHLWMKMQKQSNRSIWRKCVRRMRRKRWHNMTDLNRLRFRRSHTHLQLLRLKSTWERSFQTMMKVKLISHSRWHQAQMYSQYHWEFPRHHQILVMLHL